MLKRALALLLMILISFSLLSCEKADQETYYQRGVHAYNAQKYTLAKEYFKYVSNYLDANDYLQKIDAEEKTLISIEESKSMLTQQSTTPASTDSAVTIPIDPSVSPTPTPTPPPTSTPTPSPTPTPVPTSPSGSFTYWLAVDGKVMITKYSGSEASVIIPAAIEENPVISIGANAFKGNKSIMSVTFPGSLASIEENAFNGCIKLNFAYFSGKAPVSFSTSAFWNVSPGFLIMYKEGASGWSDPWNGFATQTY